MECACCGIKVDPDKWVICEECTELTFQVSTNAYHNNISIRDSINNMDISKSKKEFLIDWYTPFKETV